MSYEESKLIPLLGDAIVERIICEEYLSPSDLARMCCVCKRFNEICSNDSLWRRICRRRWKVWRASLELIDRWQPAYGFRNLLEHRTLKFIDRVAKQYYLYKYTIPRHFNFLSRIFKMKSVLHIEIFDDILDEIQLDSSPGDLTAKFYAREMQVHFRQYKLHAGFSPFLKTKDVHAQLPTQGALLVRQFTSPNEVVSDEECNKMIDDLAVEALAAIQQRENSNGRKATPHEVIQVIKTLLFVTHKFEVVDCALIDLEAASIDKAVKSKRGDAFLISGLFVTIAYKCGLKFAILDIFGPKIIYTKTADGEEIFVNINTMGSILKANEGLEYFRNEKDNTMPVLIPRGVMNWHCRAIVRSFVKSSSRPEFVQEMMVLHPRNFRRLRSALELLELLEYYFKKVEFSPYEDMLFVLRRHCLIVTDKKVDLEKFINSQEPMPVEKKRTKRIRQEVLYHIGMVMQYRSPSDSYQCVIMEWDRKCIIEDEDERGIYGRDLLHGVDQPFYGVLIHNRDNSYAPQEYLKPLVGREIDNDDIGRHFSSFNGRCYIPNAQIKSYYPDDDPVTCLDSLTS